MRLIDADALLKALNDYGLSYRADINGMIMQAPTIEPSGDLISRADAIEAVVNMQDGSGQTYEFVREAMFALKALPSADAVQGWIPCSERLPNDGGRYLVFYEGAIIGTNIEIMWYSEPLMPNVDVSGKHFYRSDDEWGDIVYDEVIAWMPLPTPYKGGDDE